MFSYATLYENGKRWRRENLHEGYRYAAATNQFSNRCGTLTTPTPVFFVVLRGKYRGYYRLCAVYFSLPYYHPTFHLSAPCALQSANTRLYLSKGQAHNELAPLSFGSSDGEQSVHRFIPRFHYRWRHFYNPPAHPRRGQNTSFLRLRPKSHAHDSVYRFAKRPP